MPSLALWALSHTGPIGARGSPVSLSISPFGAAARQERKRVELVPPDSLQWTPPIALALCQSLSVRSLSRDALWRGMPSTAQSSSPRSLPLNDYGTPCGVPQGSTSSHMIDTSSRRDAGSVRADSRTTRGPAARERLWGESFSGRLLAQVFEESLLLFAGQELVVSGDRVEQDLRVAIVQVRSCKEVGTNHLQTVTARFVRAQHPRCRLDRLLDDRDLALVNLEVDQLRRLLFPSRQFLLPLPPEVLLRQLSSFVQPGCTIEVLTVPAGEFR